MSEQSEMMDRVERLARELGRVERELEAAKNFPNIITLKDKMQECLTSPKPSVDPEIVRRLLKVIENHTANMDEEVSVYADLIEDNLTWGDIRRLYEALK